MRNIFRNLIPHWKVMILLVVILAVQAYCDLALPQYTQDIIDVGIQNRGVEYVLPSRITEADYRQAQTFMTGDERDSWEKAYTKEGTEGSGSLLSDTIYRRFDEGKNRLQALDDELLVPLVMAYQQKAMAESKDSDFAETMEDGESQDRSLAGEELTALAKSDPQELRKQMEKTIEAVGSQTLRSMGIAYAYQCEGDAGVDVDRKQTDYLWREGRIMALVALAMALAGIAAGYLASRTGARVGRDLRDQVFANVIGFSGKEMDQFSAASLITRCSNDIQQIQMVTVMILRMVLYAPVLGIWGVIKVVQTGAHMGWIIVLGMVAILGIILLLMTLAMPKFKMMQKLVDGLNRVSREILTGLSVIRAFGREESEEARFAVANENLMRTQLFTGRVMSTMMPVMTVIMNAMVVGIMWVAAHRIDTGDLQVGAMTAFITYAMMIVMSFLMLSMMSIMLPRAGVAADRIQEVRATKTSILEPEHPEPATGPAGQVRFSHVDFRYPGADSNALTDIDFIAQPGKTTAIIGSTGSGKSTLINLIPRFYDATGGQVIVEGTDVRRRELTELRAGIGFVPQKGTLFSGTIASNIRFGRQDADEEEIRKAARIAQADGFIEEKEKGYDDPIAQGGDNVSGGQKQRLAIARALAKEAGILIFDDSFSALDMKTDAALRRALEEEYGDTTRIIVAQRISTILHADQILVMDEGRIVGQGTHEELMEGCRVYQQIARSQLSGAELKGVKA